MSITIHIPVYWPWILACLGSFVFGVIATASYTGLAFSKSLGRIFGW